MATWRMSCKNECKVLRQNVIFRNCLHKEYLLLSQPNLLHTACMFRFFCYLLDETTLLLYESEELLDKRIKNTTR